MSIPYTWVYLLHDPFTQLYKIGKSDTPRQRVKDLSRTGTILAAPTDYQLLEAWMCPERIERELHTRYAESRQRGEWFALTEDHRQDMQIVMASYERLVAGDTYYYEAEALMGQSWFEKAKEYEAEIEQLQTLLRGRNEACAFGANAIDYLEAVEEFVS